MEPPIAPARVVKVLGRVGARGLMTAVRVELLRFPRIQMLRAVKGKWFKNACFMLMLLPNFALLQGPVRLGDIINIEEALEDVRRPM